MAKKNNIQETINIPPSLSQEFRTELGRRIVEEIRERSRRGIDKNSNTFKSYASDGDQSGTPNLSSTGDMLAELDVISIQSSTITIGYDVNHELAGQVEGNTIGSYGQPTGNSKYARDFIGLPSNIVTRIVQEIKQEPNFRETRASQDSTISNILGRLLGGS